ARIASDSTAADAPVDASASATPIMAIQGSASANEAFEVLLTLPHAIVAGDTCVLEVAIDSNSINTVTDSDGSTFTMIATAGAAAVYVASNMAASTFDTITIDFTGTATTGYTAAAEVYRGLAQ